MAVRTPLAATFATFPVPLMSEETPRNVALMLRPIPPMLNAKRSTDRFAPSTDLSTSRVTSSPNLLPSARISI